MKKKAILILSVLLSIAQCSSVYAEYSEEILFRNTPWGISFTEADEIFGDFGIWNLSGEMMKTKSVDDIVIGDYEGIRFDNSEINIIANAHNGETDVAGYTTSEICLYFAFLPVDGILTKSENDSAMYGAQYTFEPKNLNEMSNDLISKLTTLYGEPDKTTTRSDLWNVQYEYTYWYGANDTEAVLKKVDASEDTTDLYDDEIIISYVWKKGDELLQNASDTVTLNAQSKEADVYGNNSTNGL